MIELPEAIILGRQINKMLAGKTVTDVFNATSLHKFAFFNGDSLNYKTLLSGHKIVSAKGIGIFVDIALDQGVSLFINDGVKLRYGNLSSTMPDKYQLLLTLKAFLATEQRFPGIGNGVLQDILYRASLHPKRKCSSLSDADKRLLWESIRQTLADMTAKGGRDIETDLFGTKGGYKTLLSKNTYLIRLSVLDNLF